MLGEKKLKAITKTIFRLSKADQTEVLLGSGESTSIRFANSFIHQPTSRLGAWVKVRLVFGKKIGVASVNQLDRSSLEDLVKRATEICRFQKEDPNFKSLPNPNPWRSINTFDQKTASASPREVVQRVKVIIQKAKDAKLVASGNFSWSVGDSVVANSLGVWAYEASTEGRLMTVIMGQAGSGYASSFGWKLDMIDHRRVAEEAVSKALMAQKPIDLPPGEYEVILEPAAWEEMMVFFAWLGPNARIYHEDVSYFKNRLGKKVFSPKLTIVDDPFDKRGLPASFDYEGQPKRKLMIVQDGVIKNICYDSYYAQKYRKANTGHALPAPNTNGPLPTHLVIQPGRATLVKMIRRVKRGLLVTRLYYIRVVHYGEVVVSGTTRDGTFLIENGQIVKPVKNLRFTESIPRMFKNIIEIGQPVSAQAFGGSPCLVPPMRLANFRFTSQTDF